VLKAKPLQGCPAVQAQILDRLTFECSAALATPLVGDNGILGPLLLLGADMFPAVSGAGPHSTATLHLLSYLLHSILLHCRLRTIQRAGRAQTDKAASLLMQCYGPAGAAKLSRYSRLHASALNTIQKT
jgi:hypothetical protein